MNQDLLRRAWELHEREDHVDELDRCTAACTPFVLKAYETIEYIEDWLDRSPDQVDHE